MISFEKSKKLENRINIIINNGYAGSIYNVNNEWIVSWAGQKVDDPLFKNLDDAKKYAQKNMEGTTTLVMFHEELRGDIYFDPRYDI